MFCPACGFQNPATATFCGKCGANLTMAAPSPAPTPAPAPAMAQVAAPVAEPVQAPQPAPSYAQPRPAPPARSYNTRDYHTGPSPLSWFVLLASLAAIGACFLPFGQGGTEGQSLFKSVMEIFQNWSTTTAPKWILLYPGSFIYLTLFSLLLAINALPRRAGWLGLNAAIAGAATTFGIITWMGVATSGGGSTLAAGFFLSFAAICLALVLTIVQLFVESD
jgi:hypothetical protein